MNATVRTVLGIALSTWMSACDDAGKNRKEFIVQIDSLSGPTAVSGGASFQQYLYGTVGPDGCYNLKAVRLTQSATTADVTVLGEHVTGEFGCTMAIVTLRGTPLTINPPVTDPFTIRVHQPNGMILTRAIRAE